MNETIAQKTICSRILKTENIKWSDLSFLQSDEFKDFTPEEEDKLRHSVANNQFTDPFKVWLDESTGRLYCLDGKHRTIILTKLLSENVSVPEHLPATFIQCDNMQEAAKLVLQYSSSYARTTTDGLIGFLNTYELNVEDIMLDINIPDIDLDTLYGDLNKDFSTHNEELNLGDFDDEVILSLVFTREEYISVKQRLTALMGEHNVSRPEDLLKILLQLP